MMIEGRGMCPVNGVVQADGEKRAEVKLLIAGHVCGRTSRFSGLALRLTQTLWRTVELHHLDNAGGIL